MKMRLTYFVFVFTILALARALAPVLCQPGAPIFLRGQDILANSKGHLVLAAFMPLQCSHCENQLKKLQAMAETLADVRFIVIAPRDENGNLIATLQPQYPRLIIDKESPENQIYERHQAQLHDQFLFDKCGRLVQVIKHPKSDVTNYHDTLTALKAAVGYNSCGVCGPESRSRSTVNAYLLPSTHHQYQGAQVQQQAHQNRDSQEPHLQARHEPSQRHQQIRQYPETQIPAPPDYRTSQQRPQYEAQGAQIYSNPTQNYGQEEQNRRQQLYIQQLNQYRQQQQLSRPRQHFQVPTDPRRVGSPQSRRDYGSNAGSGGSTIPGPVSATQGYGSQPVPKVENTEETGGIFGRGDEDYDYSELLNWKQEEPEEKRPIRLPGFVRFARPNVTSGFHSPQQQIPATKAADPSWPTTTPYDFSIANPDIPCTAYTDEICLKQQKKFGLENMPKCCHKGIYFTDMCVPGKCSNATQQACCLQKFIQSRYRCCVDPSQGEGSETSDAFGRCCYEHFIEPDECCPKSDAVEHWQSGVYDLCLPNVVVDYSIIKMGDERMPLFDLDSDRSWEFECKYGLQRFQYPYWPWTQ